MEHRSKERKVHQNHGQKPQPLAMSPSSFYQLIREMFVEYSSRITCRAMKDECLPRGNESLTVPSAHKVLVTSILPLSSTFTLFAHSVKIELCLVNN
jgi:hypothetical protein